MLYFYLIPIGTRKVKLIIQCFFSSNKNVFIWKINHLTNMTATKVQTPLRNKKLHHTTDNQKLANIRRNIRSMKKISRISSFIIQLLLFLLTTIVNIMI